jgi:hypothetical protein
MHLVAFGRGAALSEKKPKIHEEFLLKKLVERVQFLD